MVLTCDYQYASSKEKFGLFLRDSEVVEFLQLIGLQIQSPSKEFLSTILRRTLSKIPFHNLTLLTRGLRSPTVDEIKSDMLSGLGGPCGHINPFLGALLDRLGYKVHLVSGSMMKPNCHLAILVHFAKSSYYCDCGDGRPYFDPMPVGKKSFYVHPSYSWKTYPISEIQMGLDVKDDFGKWKRNCTIDLQPRPFAYFSRSIQCHYSQDDYGPFQRGFRLVRYPKGKIIGLRDLNFLYQEGKKFLHLRLKTKEEFLQVVNSHFDISPTLVLDAINVLASRNVTQFSRLVNFSKNK